MNWSQFRRAVELQGVSSQDELAAIRFTGKGEPKVTREPIKVTTTNERGEEVVVTTGYRTTISE